METTLHRELKQIYAEGDARIEVRLGRYRIDVVDGDELIEVQHGSLAAIRDKVAKLLKKHPVRIVKPIVARSYLVRLKKKNGTVAHRRWSPKRRTVLDFFHELIYFTRVFPHPRLICEVPLVEIEETRYPGHGKRRRWRKNDHQVQDQRLLEIKEVLHFHTPDDLIALLPRSLPQPFHTGHMSEMMKIDRWCAQRIAYCLRKIGATKQVGKERNALLYEIVRKRAA